jgi:hypothetical protein
MAFTFKHEREDGTPADPPTLKAAVPNWSHGDTIPLGQAGCSASSRSARRKTTTTSPSSKHALVDDISSAFAENAVLLGSKGRALRWLVVATALEVLVVGLAVLASLS